MSARSMRARRRGHNFLPGQEGRMPLVTLLLNVLWLVFGGVWMAAAWLVAAIIIALTIIGLPWARSALTIAVYTLLPFGHTVVDRDPRRTGPLGFVGNLVWLVLAGW